MNPFEKALIQSILDDYDKIIKEQSATLDQNSHGKVEEIIEHSTIDEERFFFRWSLWIDKQSKIMYLSPHHGTEQFFFRDEESQKTCIKLLAVRGYFFNG